LCLSRYFLVYFSSRWNQRRLSLAHLECDVISHRECTGVEFYAKDPVNHFIHAPSSRSRKSTPFPTAFRRQAFRKLAYTVTETLHTWNVAFDTTKVESISLSDSKCHEIKDSVSSTRLPNLDDTITWIDSITQFLIKWTVLIKNHYQSFLFIVFFQVTICSNLG